MHCVSILLNIYSDNRFSTLLCISSSPVSFPTQQESVTACIIHTIDSGPKSIDLSGVVWTIASHFWTALVDYQGSLGIGASKL